MKAIRVNCLIYIAVKYILTTKNKNLNNETYVSSQIFGRTKKSRRVFFVECGTHAREWLSPATCMWIIKSVRWKEK
jgi:hypothetical protein